MTLPRQPMTQEQVDESWNDLGPDHSVAGTQHPSNLPEDQPQHANQKTVDVEAAASAEEQRRDQEAPLYDIQTLTTTIKLSGGNGSGGHKTLEVTATGQVAPGANWRLAYRDLFKKLDLDVHGGFNKLEYPQGTAHIDAGKNGGQGNQSGQNSPPTANPGDLGRCEEHNASYFKTENMHWPAHKVKDGDGNDMKTAEGKNVWCDKPGRPKRS